METAKQNLGGYNRKTILFIDEIHRFNKAQQDYLLPFVEDGTLVLIGATTENPYFEVNGALLSRSRIFELKPLTRENILTLIHRAFTSDRGVKSYGRISPKKPPNSWRMWPTGMPEQPLMQWSWAFSPPSPRPTGRFISTLRWRRSASRRSPSAMTRPETTITTPSQPSLNPCADPMRTRPSIIWPGCSAPGRM